VPEEESAESGSSEVSEEYYEPSEEAIEVESKELSIPEVEVFVERSELWDKMVRGEISLEKGAELHRELASRIPTVTVSTGRRRRRRK